MTLAKNPKMSAGPTPPKKSPIMLPIPAPQAAAGPNMNEHTTGMALAGRSSVTPGINGTTLNGTSTAAYSAAQIALNTTILVLLHIERSSLIARDLEPGWCGKSANSLKFHDFSLCQYGLSDPIRV